MTQRTSARPPITVTLITLNEAANLPRALESVAGWAEEIIVIDSGSSDQTLDIARRAGAKVFQNPWSGYGKQKNFAQDRASHDWILNLDADEALTPELRAEIDRRLAQAPQPDGFQIPRKTWYLKKWILHGGWYPNHLVRLARKSKARWSEPAVHEAWVVQGSVEKLKNPLLHYPFEKISDQVIANLRYSREGFIDLKTQGRRASTGLLIAKPVGKFLETYVWKRGFLDGMPGFIISVSAAYSIFLKYAYFFDENESHENPGH